MIERRLFGASLGCLAVLPISGTFAASDREAIEEAYRRWNDAFNAKDPNRLAALYSERALLLPAGQDVIFAQEPIARFWEGMMRSGITDHSLHLLEASGDQRVVASAAKWGAKRTGAGGMQLIAGNVAHVFLREQDGLRLWLHIWN